MSRFVLMGLILPIAAGSCTLGTTLSTIEITARPASSGPEFQFRECQSQEKWRKIPPLSVYAIEDGRPREVCTLSLGPTDSQQEEDSWRYGVAPKGYVIDGCAALVEGQSYLVRAYVAGGGMLKFRLADNGDVVVLEKNCCVDDSGRRSN